MGKFVYKSYCWNLGTTSFRTKNFNRTIEIQLDLLDQFWKLPQNQNKTWSENSTLQAGYYDFLKQNEFVDGSAARKDKDAREKTSGLVELGLLNSERKLTNVGRKVLQISKNGDFSVDNGLQISKDSFIYLKQLLKTSNYKIEDNVVRPFIVTLYMLSRHGYLSDDEFTYLLPLCTNVKYTEFISNQILLLRQNKINIDEIIIKNLLSMPNYKGALEWFLNCSNISKNTFCDIGMNRKSATFDSPYYKVYLTLKNIFLDGNRDASHLVELFLSIQKLNLKKWWNSYIFAPRTTEKKIKNELDRVLNDTIFDDITNEAELKTSFFKTMHLFKVKATLYDYFDLNRRYMGLSDIFLFRDSKIQLDIVPKHFFNSVINELYNDAYKESNLLQDDCELNEISSMLVISDNTIISSINNELGLSITSLDGAINELEKERYSRFNKLIDEKFSNTKLIELLGNFENRDDGKIKEYITDNAEVYTIFEYVLGIAWYKISERKGKILDYMKLSLDANLLPKSHAGGGEADIVYEYDETEHYPKHTLLIEATLSNKAGQRQMELEPVTRHLGQHLLQSGNLNSYCVFATTRLDINTLSDFRNRKIYPFYDTNDSSKHVKGMKIASLQTTELKTIIQNNKKYSELYSIFDKAYRVDLDKLEANEWYQKYIVEKL
ncbi:AlwI family type II restriction endonuclease [Campylobacter insulaenigrae]|uniref:AlwI family type II restriction endonuclease n=1 Tax=Campylobacter insulaenigrae TaxID=260714 RepID=UPI00215233F1|nr:AlwI family type II restriction endonuclease [Campylobacter insulaenigrae]MCR6578528.1 AlwI family type II restriction endonuclease [Campylobacter insulaenigrae]